jgi:poly(3-hydroxybutyrate) depolymerase
MLYHTYELQRSWMNSASALASISSELLSNPANPMGYLGAGPMVANALEVFAHATAHYGKPVFGITDVTIDGKVHAVTESTALHRPFGDLLRFHVEGTPADRPRLLIVAPMSGHYATLLRGTVERMLESCEVFITDWADAKMVPISAGTFDLDEYIDYLIEFAEHIHAEAGGPRIHMMAVCQPSVPAFAATALMNLHKSPATPATLTMMGGPIDTRECPTVVNNMAMQRPIAWFRQTVIATVPLKYPGAGRRVYPGFMQLSAFMSMNQERHRNAFRDYYLHLVDGEHDKAEVLWTEALGISRDLGERNLEGMLLTNMGETSLVCGRFEEARDRLLGAIELLEQVGDRRSLAEAHRNLGSVHLRLDDYTHALEHSRRALEIGREVGARTLAALADRNLGEVFSRTLYDDLAERDARIERAAGHFAASIEALESAGSQAELAKSLLAHGAFLAELGRVEAARAELERARELFTRFDMRDNLERTDRILRVL